MFFVCNSSILLMTNSTRISEILFIQSIKSLNIKRKQSERSNIKEFFNSFHRWFNPYSNKIDIILTKQDNISEFNRRQKEESDEKKIPTVRNFFCNQF